MLGETELRDTKQQFWRRYKMRFSILPIRPYPGWPGRSRGCSACTNIWRVKALQSQLTTSQKKRKLSEGLFIEDGEGERGGGTRCRQLPGQALHSVCLPIRNGRLRGVDGRAGRCRRIESGLRHYQVCDNLRVLLLSQEEHHALPEPAMAASS